MGIAYNTSIVSDGLVFALDAANSRSYAGSGLTAFSLVNTFNLTLNNGVGITSSNAGMFVFDGTNDYMSSSDFNIPFTNNGQYTFEAVCKFNTNPNAYQTVFLYGNSNYEGLILGKSRSGYANGALYGGVYWPGNAVISIGSSTGSQIVSMGVVHFTFTLSKPSTVYVAKLYINGVLDNTTTSSVTNYSLSTLNLFTVGGPNFDFVNGNIAVLKVYNRALSDAEVKQNYNASKKRYGL